MIERPNTQFRIYRSTIVGDNQGGGIGAMRLQGSRIRGVIVDNPSGSWVKLDGPGLGFQPYIAPYTLAWAVSLLPSVDEIIATYTVGPVGQPSSLAGAPLVVYLFEAQVPSSAGSTFSIASGLTQISTVGVLAVAATQQQQLVAAVASQRISVLSVAVGYDWAAGNRASYQYEIPVLVQPYPFGSPGSGLAVINVNPQQPSIETVYPGGLSLAPGVALYAALTALWGATPIVITALYIVV